MASIQSIEEFLNIELADKRLCDGKYKKNKNQFYYFRDEYYIVKASAGTWFIASDCRRTRQLLRGNTWCMSTSYIYNGKNKLFFHREALRCDDDLKGDHINRCAFDNRVDNLRMATITENSRNRTISSNNTSGKNGVSRAIVSGYPYWIVQIRDNDGARVQRNFSINKLGEDEAFERAKQCRIDLELEYGYLGD